MIVKDLLSYIFINNLILVYFISFEDIKLKDYGSFTKKHIIRTLIGLFLYLVTYPIYFFLKKNNLVFLNPIFYILIIFLTLELIKLIEHKITSYIKTNLEFFNSLIISSTTITGSIFFIFKVENNFFLGSIKYIFANIGIALMLFLLLFLKNKINRENYEKDNEREAMYFFMLFIISLIPNILELFFGG